MIRPETRGERWALYVARQARRYPWAPAAYCILGVLNLLLWLIMPSSSLASIWIFSAAWFLALALGWFERLQFGNLLDRQTLVATEPMRTLRSDEEEPR